MYKQRWHTICYAIAMIYLLVILSCKSKEKGIYYWHKSFMHCTVPWPNWPWNSTVHNWPWTSTQDLFHPNSWQTPVAAVTVYSAPGDGCKGRPKHVEHTCSC